MKRAVHTLCMLASSVASIALIGMMLLITADVTWDFVFGRPITNTAEIVSVYLMVAIVFFPFGSVELRNDHINADILVRLLPASAQKGIYVLTSIASIIFVVVMFYQTGIDALAAMNRQEMIMGTDLLVVWPSRFCLPIGYALLAIAMSANLIQALSGTDSCKDVSSVQQKAD